MINEDKVKYKLFKKKGECGRRKKKSRTGRGRRSWEGRRVSG
jgi:hypothetical protein